MEMYPDTVLFIAGGFFALLTVLFFIYLLAFRKRSRVYAEVLRQETETFDALTATATLTRNKLSTGNKSASGKSGTEELPRVHAPASTERFATGPQGLPGTEKFATDNVTSSQAVAQTIAKPDASGFDPSVIADLYTVEYEIGGGAMSRTFVVRNKKLDNLWFLKFVSGKHGKLASEEHILKLLNHVSLPKIIDVYYREEGTYLIETLVEGVSLDKIASPDLKLSQYVILEWFEQAAQALNYLHNIKPNPVFHLDLKPGNIMVTHDNRLVLVDFGVSRRFGDDGSNAVTAKYAAPEQFGGRIPSKFANLIYTRFGQLPSGFERWGIDARTDIFSMGVIMFELATGQSPSQANIKILDNHVSRELSKIIKKCLNINPDARYATIEEVLEELRKVKGTKIKMARSLLVRRFAAVAAAFCLLAAVGCVAVGYNVFAVENAAVISSRPDVITVSLQQSSVFDIDREMPNGDIIPLDGTQIRWQPTGGNIAHIDGNRVTGLNIGRTLIEGSHRNGDITLDVRVVEPMHGMVEISQRYQAGRTIEIAMEDFFSPESIVAAPGGVLYISDAGVIRRVRGNIAETIPMPAEFIFITADMVRHSGSDLFIKTAPWVDLDERDVYALARVRDGFLEIVFLGDARNTAIEDFAFCNNGRLYFIERNAGLGAVFLRSLDPVDRGDIVTHYRLPEGSVSIAVSDDGAVYIGNTSTGAVQVYYDGELRNFAGLADDRAFIDGTSPRFYLPQRLDYHSGYLYIWDFNTLRRIEARGVIAGEAITIAGMAYPVYDREPGGISFPAEDIILPHGRLMDFTVTDNEVFITDHKRGVVWRVDY